LPPTLPTKTPGKRLYFGVETIVLRILLTILDFCRLDLDLVFKHSDYKFVLGGQTKLSFPSNGERRIDESVVSLGYRDGKLFAPSLTYKQTSGAKESQVKKKKTKRKKKKSLLFLSL
jgi:hypothetical protein